MNLILMIICVTACLLPLFLVLMIIISEFNTKSREESTSYECGFEQNSLARITLSIRYFFLTLLFLIFDLEIVLVLVLVPSVAMTSSHMLAMGIFMFLLVLLMGLIYEWKDGSLDWVDL